MDSLIGLEVEVYLIVPGTWVLGRVIQTSKTMLRIHYTLPFGQELDNWFYPNEIRLIL